MGSRLENNSTAVRKRIEQHKFNDEQGEEYKASAFGGFSDYFRRKKIKLQNLDAELRTQTADNPHIFRGTVCHVNGYTQPSLNDIHRLIVSHGGGFMQYLDGKTTVTHIIASTLTPKKAVEFQKYRIVKPAWIVDSVKAGKLLPWHAYRVLDEGAGQKVLGFDDGKITSQINTKQKGYRDQSDTSWYTSQLTKKEDSATTQLPTSGGSTIPREDATVDDSALASVGLEPGEEEQDGQSETAPEDQFEQSCVYRKRDSDLSASMQEEFGHDLDDVEDDGGAPLPAESLQTSSHASDPNMQLSGRDLEGIETEQRPLDDHPELSVERSIGTPKATDLAAGAELVAEPLAAHELTTRLGDTDRGSLMKRELDAPTFSPSKRSKLTAEEHNSILLSDPRIRQSSVLNPDFLEQYYRESRLHHLSAWKADLKAQLQAATAAKSSSQKSKQKRAPGARRYILHVDFDSFFVAVSLKNHLEYVDKPACVAHGPGPNSEIASCNYPSRKFGVKNGMWMKHAHEICKDLKVLPYDFPAYEEASKLFYDAIMATDGIVQSVSIDEALVDVTGTCLLAGGTDGVRVREGSIWREEEKADEIAQNLRKQVKEQTGCAVSVGIGSNILLAKVALRKAKPAGQHQIKPEEVLDFLANLEVEDLPGVAHSIGGKLEEIGIKLVKDIREVSKEKLINVLGPKTGEKIWNYSRGIDRTEVGDQVVRKSVSAEVNWGVRFETQEQSEDFVESLCGELHRRLLKEGVKGTHLTMKVMRRAADAPLDPPKHLGHGKCDTYNKSVVLGVATNGKDVLTREIMSIFRGFGITPGELRGLGVQMTKLEPLKTSIAGDVASSQRRLQFKTSAQVRPLPVNEGQRPPSDQHQMPMQPAHQPNNNRADTTIVQKRLQFKTNANRSEILPSDADPIHERLQTPRKAKASRFATEVSTTIPHVDSPGRKLLNTMGTQFIMPTQVDPQVLAELPPDIRSRLLKRIDQPKKPAEAEKEASARDVEKPKQFTSSTILPNQSQLDPDILNALPEDMRDEILAHYSTSPSRPKGQTRLPQSPHKNRPVAPIKSIRARTRGSSTLLSRLKGARSTSYTNTLTQSNFVSNKTVRATSHDHTDSDAGEVGITDSEIAPEFLEALPAEIRREVLAQHRAKQLKQHAGLEVSRRPGGGGARGRRGDPGGGADAPSAFANGELQPQIGQSHISGEDSRERILLLPPREARPTFTTKKLSEVGELREAVSLWLEEFRAEGPYDEDVEALRKYLRAVVSDEGDMSKAMGVVKWMEWKIGEGEDVHTKHKADERWNKALDSAKECVKQAVRERGLGSIDV